MALATTRRLNVENTGIWVLLALTVLFASITIPAFRDPANLANVLRQSSILGLIAIGQTFVIAAGMIDLSVGMIAGLVVVLACWALGIDPSLTILVMGGALIIGAGVGAFNGILVNALRIHPLILTFGMLSVLQGLIFTFTDRSVGLASPLLQLLANGNLVGVPIAALILLGAMVAMHWLLSSTRFGYHLLAAGGNPESARRAGINVERMRFLAFVISGACAAAGGLLLAGRLGTGYPLAGTGLELDAIVAVVLGGTALAGGRASVIRTVAGVVALATMSNVLNLLEVSAFVQMFLKGLIVVAAILVNQPRRELR
ncbi:MAG: ABC transporter permease [Mesorhizobium sp.]|nr:ABC transporter permease [Mesorhizobium sp.]